MRMHRLLLVGLILTPVLLVAQSGGLDPATLLRPPADSWPSYSGDLTGRRYSPLKQIDKTNVKHLSLAWVARGFTEGSGATGRGNAGFGGGGGGGRGGGGAAVPLIVSGLGSGEYNSGGPPGFRGSIVMVDGVRIRRRRTMCGRSTRATVRSSGSTTGRRAAARIPDIAVSGCGATSSSPNSTTITS
ncbi:MAG: hypothetical protein ACRD2N_22470 [Vicinamibacterales bacterium]